MENEITEPYNKGLIKEKKGFSLVWIVPIVAVIITVGMIYKSYVDQGTRIYITIEDGAGIIDGKTPLMYKGIKIGSVEDVRINKDDVSMLQLTVVVDKASSAAVARKGNKFWKVEPKISLTEVSGLDTLIKGVYIAVMPAATTKKDLLALPFEKNFIALDRPPVDVFRPGLALKVNTVNKGDISIGAPILYNKQVIGKIEDKKLSKDRLSINLFIRIDEEYMDLIHDKSIFYKLDAIEVKASLSSVKINMGSFASFITGGIAIHNNEEAIKSPLCKEGVEFSLYDNYDEIMLSNDEVVLEMQEQHQLASDISKLYYKGVEAGTVKKIHYDPIKDQTTVNVKIHNDFRGFANKKAYFWIVKPQLDFDGVEGLDTIVRGNYINFISEDIHAHQESRFTLHEVKPQAKGVHIKLISQDIQSVKEGAGVFYHNIKIGVVNSYFLNKDKKTFTVDIIIQPKYKKLLNASSSFYHNSGVSFEASLDKVLLSTGSMETILRGGISVETSRFKKVQALKKEYILFSSHKDMLKEQYLAAKGMYLTLIASRAGSLKVGSPLFYKQIKVGEVLSTQWDSGKQHLQLKVFIIEEYAKEVHESTLFYNASGISASIDLNGLSIETQSLETIVAGGIAFFTPSPLNLKPVQKQEFILYKNKKEASKTYFNIKLLSRDSAGLKEGSALKYKNVIIGQVEKIDLQNKDVIVYLQIDAKYKYLVNAETIFWLEGFTLGLDGVKNVSSVLTGPSITLKPGDCIEQSDRFSLMLKAPVPHFHEDGLRITLKAARRGGIKAGTPVYFRQIKIGSVVEYFLNGAATGINITAFIEPCYSHLIRKNSYFFNASGIGMEVSLFGAKVKTETIESIITGGIGVFTPDDYNEEAQDKDTFTLNESFDEDALEWEPKLHSTKESCQ